MPDNTDTMTNGASYVRYSDSIEVQQPDEAELTDKIVASISRVNSRIFDKHRHAIRNAHAKNHGVLKGTLTVYSGLNATLSQGLFRAARDYPVVARLSSAPGDIHDDRIGAPKGLAMKVIGVEGPRSLPSQNGDITQDFLMVNAPAIPFGHVAAYWEMQQKLEKHAEDSELVTRLASEVAGKAAPLLHRMGLDNPTLDALGTPNRHILGETFYSMAAVRYGDYVAKISLAPLSESVRRLTGTIIDTEGKPSAFRDKVTEFFQSQGAEYEMRVQLCVDLERMPVEDASIEWPESLSAWRPVGKVTFPRQDSFGPERRVYADDILSFSPWHSLSDHRPLGSIMRVRVKAYATSGEFRHRMNARPPHEPRDISEIPD
jgi:hypothetical protein